MIRLIGIVDISKLRGDKNVLWAKSHNRYDFSGISLGRYICQIRDRLFDSFSLWDKDSGEPKMIANGTGSNLSIVDKESYQTFLDKG